MGGQDDCDPQAPAGAKPASAYRHNNWFRQVDAARSPVWKRIVYVGARPILAALARRKLPERYLREVGAGRVFFSRGTPLEWRRRWGSRGMRLNDATIWVAGTGSGWDVVSWAELRPRRIIATDLFEFAEAWTEIARHVRDRLGVDVEFRQAPLEDHGFLRSGAVDLCASDAVFEHCRDLPSVLAEMHRVVRPGGMVYATYGPLWFAPGGDHFSGRGGLRHAYNHIALPADEYRRYFEAHCSAVEDFQSGGRYVEIDLFSKMTTRQYVAAFRNAGFRVDELILELCRDAFHFASAFPEWRSALQANLEGRCEPEDLLIKANYVRLRRP